MSSVAVSGNVNQAPEAMHVVIPVLNDWEAVGMLLERLDHACRDSRVALDVLLIDDGSQLPAPPTLVTQTSGAIARVRVLRLRRNLGHQRAICIGLAWLSVQDEQASVLIMDGDGEDSPDDVPRLLQEFRQSNQSHLVFASRTRRSEGVVFTFFYKLYRGMHHLLTGIPVEVGNFSIIPPTAVETLSVTAECWNHYAAAVVAARLPRRLVPTQRAHRLHGVSRMNFSALVLHGLSAMSVFADRLGVRMLNVLAVVCLGLIGALVAIVGIRFLTDLAIPGWATTAAGTLLVLLVQTVILAAAFTFMILSSRSGSGFVPRRDHALFVSRVDVLYGIDD